MKLVSPSIQYEKEYKAMLDDWNASKEKYVPFVLGYNCSDFNQFLERLEFDKKIGEEKFVPHSTFLLLNEEDQVVGVSNIRHQLNEKLKICGGHIGYGVRPGFRRRGYATKMLQLSLLEARRLGIKKVMVTCDKINIASAKTILKNGGVLEREVIYEGDLVQNYWIDNE